MRILGVDPGYGRLGFGVVDNETALSFGVITTEKGDMGARLQEIARDVRQLIKKYKPELLVIEELFFSKSVTTGLKVAEVRGVIMLLAAEAGIRVVEVKPSEVKMSVTGYGRADKRQMQQMIKTIFKLSRIPKPDDAADALAIAWCGQRK